MISKCTVKGVQIEPCSTLGKALEYGNPRPRSKGIFLPERVDIKTGERGAALCQLHSGDYVGRGVVMNHCPFCGESLKTW